jgi:hypothetical protein
VDDLPVLGHVGVGVLSAVGAEQAEPHGGVGPEAGVAAVPEPGGARDRGVAPVLVVVADRAGQAERDAPIERETVASASGTALAQKRVGRRASLTPGVLRAQG